MARRAPHTLALLFLVLVTPAMMPYAFLDIRARMIGDLGDAAIHVAVMEWEIESLRHHPAKLFDAPFLYPCKNTVAFSESNLAALLLALPLRVVTGDLVVTYNSTVILTFVLTAIFAYLLLYHCVRLRMPALLGALAFTYSTYRFAHIVQLQLISTHWIPLCLLSLHLVVERGRWYHWGMFFACYTLNTLSSWYHAFHLSLLIAVIAPCLLLQWRRRPRRSDLLPFAIGAVLSALLIALVAVRYLRLPNEFAEATRTMDEVTGGGAFLEDFWTTHRGNLLYSRLLGRWTSAFVVGPHERPRSENEHALFPGLGLLALAMAGLVWWLGRPRSGAEASGAHRYALAYAIAGSVALVFSLGPALQYSGQPQGPMLPYAFAYHLVPGIKALRFPNRFAIGLQLALCVFAAVGLCGIQRWLRDLFGARAGSLIAALAVALILFESYASPIKMTPVPPEDEIPQVYRKLERMPDRGALLDLTPEFYTSRDLPVDSVAMYTQTIHRKPMYNGFSGFVPLAHRSYRLVLQEFPSPLSVAVMQHLGIRYVLIHRDLLPRDLEERMRTLARNDRIYAEAGRVPGVAILHEDSDKVLYGITAPDRPRTSGVGISVSAPSSVGAGRAFAARLEISAGVQPVVFLPQEDLHLRCELTSESGTQTSHLAKLYSPGLIMPGRSMTQPVDVPPPSESGRYVATYRLMHDGQALVTTAKEARLVVQAAMPTSIAADRLAAEFSVRASPPRLAAGQAARIRATVVNRSDALWCARPPARFALRGLKLSPSRYEPYRFSLPSKVKYGAVMLVARWALSGQALPADLEERQPWMVHYFGLPFDLGRGDAHSTELQVIAPREPGRYDLWLGLKVIGRAETLLDITGDSALSISVGQ